MGARDDPSSRRRPRHFRGTKTGARTARPSSKSFAANAESRMFSGGIRASGRCSEVVAHRLRKTDRALPPGVVSGWNSRPRNQDTMPRSTRLLALTCNAIALMLALALLLALADNAHAQTPTVTTDKDDYVPGEPVIISGQ